MSHVNEADETRIAYIEQLESSLRQLQYMPAPGRMPWSLMALSATFYLAPYLSTSIYRNALESSLRAARQAAMDWSRSASSLIADEVELYRLTTAETNRSSLYRRVFERATSPAHVLLTQHACEIAEVVDGNYLVHALRMSLIHPSRFVHESLTPRIEPPSEDELMTRLSLALLVDQLSPARFTLGLLYVHAARRARELVDPAFDIPLRVVAQRVTRLIPQGDLEISMSQEVRPHVLAERAIACGQPWALLVVEAGLTEAEVVDPRTRSLLLAALDAIF